MVTLDISRDYVISQQQNTACVPIIKGKSSNFFKERNSDFACLVHIFLTFILWKFLKNVQRPVFELWIVNFGEIEMKNVC
jgi:hypothetical protein